MLEAHTTLHAFPSQQECCKRERPGPLPEGSGSGISSRGTESQQSSSSVHCSDHAPADGMGGGNTRRGERGHK